MKERNFLTDEAQVKPLVEYFRRALYAGEVFSSDKLGHIAVQIHERSFPLFQNISPDQSLSAFLESPRFRERILHEVVASLTGAEPGMAIRLSPDGASLEPFRVPGSIAFYAYLDPKKSFTSDPEQLWQIVPLDKTMYDSHHAFNSDTHSFVAPVDGIFLFVGKVWADESMRGQVMSVGLCDNLYEGTGSKLDCAQYNLSYPRWETTVCLPKEVTEPKSPQRDMFATTVGVYFLKAGQKVGLVVTKSALCGDAAPIQGRTSLFGIYMGHIPGFVYTPDR